MESSEIKIDWKEVKDIKLAGIDTKDYPDFCDAFIESATYKNREATEEELEAMSDDSEVVNKLIFDKLF